MRILPNVNKPGKIVQFVPNNFTLYFTTNNCLTWTEKYELKSTNFMILFNSPLLQLWLETISNSLLGIYWVIKILLIRALFLLYSIISQGCEHVRNKNILFQRLRQYYLEWLFDVMLLHSCNINKEKLMSKGNKKWSKLGNPFSIQNHVKGEGMLCIIQHRQRKFWSWEKGKADELICNRLFADFSFSSVFVGLLFQLLIFG